jgi:hypothetical protein
MNTNALAFMNWGLNHHVRRHSEPLGLWTSAILFLDYPLLASISKQRFGFNSGVNIGKLKSLKCAINIRLYNQYWRLAKVFRGYKRVLGKKNVHSGNGKRRLTQFHNNEFKVLIKGVIPLFFALSIYFLFRNPKDMFLGLFEDFNHLNYKPLKLPDYLLWIDFNLPDALWLLSLFNFLKFVWHNNIKPRIIWLVIALFCAVILEIAQKIAYLPGTFDLNDLLFYFLTFILFVTHEIIKQ